MRDTPTVKTTTRTDGNRMYLVIEGAAETESMETLATAIADVDRQAKSRGSAVVHADLRDLEFATSSCLKIFASWVVAMPDPAPYKIIFLSNPEHSWQRRSLNALTMCSPTVASVEI